MRERALSPETEGLLRRHTAQGPVVKPARSRGVLTGLPEENRLQSKREESGSLESYPSESSRGAGGSRTAGYGPGSGQR